MLSANERAEIFAYIFSRETNASLQNGRKEIETPIEICEKKQKQGKGKFKQYEHKACSSVGILSIYHSVLSFTEKIIRFKKTLSDRFVWFVITSWF